MAFTATVQTASIRLSSVLALQEKITFDDIEGDPSTTVNWMSNAVLNDLDLKTAVTATAANPNQTATTQIWGSLITASGTSHTLDLSALPRDACLSALDLTGLKIQGYLMQAPWANTADVTVVTGATNGYDLMDQALFKLGITPGGVELCWFPENTDKTVGMPDVAVADAELDFASTMSNFQIFVALFAG